MTLSAQSEMRVCAAPFNSQRAVILTLREALRKDLRLFFETSASAVTRPLGTALKGTGFSPYDRPLKSVGL
jgi:hypothetical protein